VPVDALRLTSCGAAVPDDAPLCRTVRAHATLRLSLRTRGACPDDPQAAHLARDCRSRAHQDLVCPSCAFRRAQTLRPSALGERLPGACF
jgi:hypothetical protein